MDLHSDHFQAEIESDLLVELPAYHRRHYLGLTLCKRRGDLTSSVGVGFSEATFHLLTLLQRVAPDVGAWICGPTLRLAENESRESYTIPWGDDEAIDAFAGALRTYELGAAEEFLILWDVLEMLEASGWRRAVPPTRRRTRPYLELGAEA